MSTDSRVAFALRDELADSYLGGIVRAGDRDLNVLELLEDGDGTIVVDQATNGFIVAVLDHYTALERVEVPDDVEGTTPLERADLEATALEDLEPELEGLTVAELRSRAAAEGITLGGSPLKADLVVALTTAAALRAGGVVDPAGQSVDELVELADQAAAADPVQEEPEATASSSSSTDQEA